MFSITDELKQLIENIQYKAISALNIEPEIILKENSEKDRLDREHSIKGINLEEEYLAAKADNFYSWIPEHHYDVSFEYFKFYRNCRVTKYDDFPFLGRFGNVGALCHEYYTRGDPSLKRNIIVTSLPFLNVNGFCLNHGNDTNIVFLNYGLVGSISNIYKFLLPLCNPELFGEGSKNNNLNHILDIILSSCFLKNAFGKLAASEQFKYAHANESWCFTASLQQHVKETIIDKKNKDPLIIRHPSTLPFSQKMAHFLACRGAFVFLLGHEFAHAYGNHCSVASMNDINLRDPQMLTSLSQKFEKELAGCRENPIYSKHFCVEQPIEEEADAHGLICVVKYCADNELDDRRTNCVLIGAIATFIVMELHKTLSIIQSSSAEEAEELLTRDPILSNILTPGHPAPVTRLFMALQREVFQDGAMAGILEIFKSLDGGFAALHNQINASVINISSTIKKLLESSDMLNIDLNDVFSEFAALGVNDFSRRYYPLSHYK